MKMTLAYIAGFLDGDGFITFHHPRIRNTGKPMRNRAITPHVGFTNTSLLLLEEIQKTLNMGGYIEKHKNYSSKHKQSYSLHYSGEIAENLCEKLEPLLFLKSTQAHLVLALRDWKIQANAGNGRSKGWDNFDNTKWLNSMRVLNARGPK